MQTFFIPPKQSLFSIAHCQYRVAVCVEKRKKHTVHCKIKPLLQNEGYSNLKQGILESWNQDIFRQ